MSRSVGFLAIFSVVSFGCAASQALIPIDFKWRDNVAARRIDLSFANSRSYPVCLTPSQWPNAAGKLDQAQEQVSLFVGIESFPIEDFNVGYCPYDCSLRVGPGETVTGYLWYSDFRLPERLVGVAGKILEFKPHGYRCR